jgi:hypothetical protein
MDKSLIQKRGPGVGCGADCPEFKSAWRAGDTLVEFTYQGFQLGAKASMMLMYSKAGGNDKL